MKIKRRAVLIALVAVVIAGWLGLVLIERLYDEPENYSLIEDGLWMGGDAAQPPPGTVAVLNLCEKKDPSDRHPPSNSSRTHRHPLPTARRIFAPQASASARREWPIQFIWRANPWNFRAETQEIQETN